MKGSALIILLGTMLLAALAFMGCERYSGPKVIYADCPKNDTDCAYEVGNGKSRLVKLDTAFVYVSGYLWTKGHWTMVVNGKSTLVPPDFNPNNPRRIP
jgi:hypothetical protein